MKFTLFFGEIKIFTYNSLIEIEKLYFLIWLRVEQSVKAGLK